MLTLNHLTGFGVGAAAEVDPLWSNVVLALPMDGVDGATTFPDLKGRTVSVVGDARISAAQARFGGTSGFFDGADDHLSISYAADWHPGGVAFTVEGWAYPLAVGGYNVLAAQWRASSAGSSSWTLETVGNDWQFWVSNGTSMANASAGAGAVALNAWQHVAAVFDGAAIRVYVNGVGGTPTAFTGFAHSALPLRIGALEHASGSGGDGYWNGWLDDVRITKGAARYAANFTPPTAPFAAG